jgi:hypothetical protein
MYTCQRCGYGSKYISHFKKHLSRKKVCEPLYANVDRAALLDALKTSDGKEACKTLTVVQTKIIPYEEIEDAKAFTMHIQGENATLKHEVVALKKENADLASRLQAYQAGSGGSVTNNNVTHITHIHINNFGHENTEYITDDFLGKAVRRIRGAIPMLLRQIHFNPNHPENHNVKLPNKRDKYMMVRRNGEWRHESRKEVIKRMVHYGHKHIDENIKEGMVERMPEFSRQVFHEYMDKVIGDDDEVRADVDSRVEVMLLDAREG